MYLSCMYLSMYPPSMYLSMNPSMYLYNYVSMCICIIYVCMYLCIYVSMYVYIMYVCMYVCMYMYVSNVVLWIKLSSSWPQGKHSTDQTISSDPQMKLLLPYVGSVRDVSRVTQIIPNSTIFLGCGPGLTGLSLHGGATHSDTKWCLLNYFLLGLVEAPASLLENISHVFNNPMSECVHLLHRCADVKRTEALSMCTPQA